MGGADIFAETAAEADAMSRMHHENTLRFFGICYLRQRGAIAMVTELCEVGRASGAVQGAAVKVFSEVCLRGCCFWWLIPRVTFFLHSSYRRPVIRFRLPPSPTHADGPAAVD